jgi:hypothetical protein
VKPTRFSVTTSVLPEIDDFSNLSSGDDPGFVDAAGANYHLRLDSPAIDYHLAGNLPSFDPPRNVESGASRLNRRSRRIDGRRAPPGFCAPRC